MESNAQIDCHKPMPDGALREVCDFVENVTCIHNLSSFLFEIVRYYNRNNSEGGIAGVNRARYDYVRNYRLKYSYWIDGKRFIVDTSTYVRYAQLRTNPFAALIYAAAYIEIFTNVIPDTQIERFHLFAKLFDAGACVTKYTQG